MRHFIAYHNTEKMGRHLHEGDPLRLLTNKTVNHLLQNTLWMVIGQGTETRRYSLGSVFLITEIGDVAQDGFTRFAAGPGHVFQPPIVLNEMEWFPELLRATGHFAFGVAEVKADAIVVGLTQLAAASGFTVV